MKCWFGKNRSVTRVKLVGGIGNQLFGYFAALDIAMTNRYRVAFDVTDAIKIKDLDLSGIEMLRLPGPFVQQNKITKLIDKIKIKLNLGFFFPKKIFHSQEIGFNSKLYNIKPGTLVNGYFQTYKHFDRVKDSLKTIELKSTSQWFQAHLQNFKSKNVLSIHVRRGDYEKLEDLYGLLSQDYYKDALNALNAVADFSEIYVFSDDIEAAKTLLAPILTHTVTWINPSQSKNPVEQLILMSYSSSIIIANSTFSWWGATLNYEKPFVCAPSKWYKGMSDPKYLIPKNWILVESKWL